MVNSQRALTSGGALPFSRSSNNLWILSPLLPGVNRWVGTKGSGGLGVSAGLSSLAGPSGATGITRTGPLVFRSC